MKFIAALFGKSSVETSTPELVSAPHEVTAEGLAEAFPLFERFFSHEGLPILDWAAASKWASQSTTAEQELAALNACKRGWLLHMRDALGDSYELRESSCALVLSPYSGRAANAMLEFIARTRGRIADTLEGLTRRKDEDRDVLIVFGDDDTYYRYVSHAYPEDGEFAFSGGMFLHADCPHFVTMAADTSTVERVIAHEMTHAAVSHLSIPLWINEGLAVNTENRLMGTMPSLYSAAEMRAKHLSFWTSDTIQEFWSGRAFSRPDEGSMLSYDLARTLVEILAGHWTQFRAFATSAHYEDGGAAAAREHLELDLGESLASMFEQPSDEAWQPDPKRWADEVAKDPD
jgi:hypothetical protein